jgi:hypothetical protein
MVMMTVSMLCMRIRLNMHDRIMVSMVKVMGR